MSWAVLEDMSQGPSTEAETQDRHSDECRGADLDGP